MTEGLKPEKMVEKLDEAPAQVGEQVARSPLLKKRQVLYWLRRD